MPGLKKAELLEGEVYIPSPVRWNLHACPHAGLLTWLGVYEVATPGVQAGGNSSVRLDAENMPQPDGVLIVDPAHGGRVIIGPDDYIEGSPELAAEVAASSVALDLHRKFHVYRRHQVQEYVVWRVFDGAVDWFVLRGSEYQRLPLNPAGIYQSEVFPGLWLDPAALGRFDMATVLQVLQQGIASPEHAAFVAQLASAAQGRAATPPDASPGG
jgi:hypothetical protein